MKIFRISFVALIFLTIFSCKSNVEEKRLPGETLIVLGFPANDDGTASEVMKMRLDLALEIYQNKKVSTIIVTGGAVQNSYPEAEVMRNYLIEKGVKSSEIIMEKEAKSTFENAMKARKILKKYGLKNPIIVTTPEHRERAANIFRLFISEFRMAE